MLLMLSPTDLTAWDRFHEIRLRGMMHDADDTDFRPLIEAGYVVRRGSLLAITPMGRAVHAAWARLPESSDEEMAAQLAYERFLVLDKQVKQLTTAWQLASTHARPDGYREEEWKLIDRLIALNEKAGAMLLHLGRVIQRFGDYRSRRAPPSPDWKRVTVTGSAA
jgi:hypothetical protein